MRVLIEINVLTPCWIKITSDRVLWFVHWFHAISSMAHHQTKVWWTPRSAWIRWRQSPLNPTTAGRVASHDTCTHCQTAPAGHWFSLASWKQAIYMTTMQKPAPCRYLSTSERVNDSANWSSVIALIQPLKKARQQISTAAERVVITGVVTELTVQYIIHNACA